MKQKRTLVRNTYQQGDLLLRRLTKLPPGEVKVLAKSRLVLAHGESGHSHVVECDDAELVQVGEQIIMRLKSQSPVLHEEHNAPTSLIPDPVMLDAGVWEIGRVKEFDYLSMMERQVMD